MTKRLVAVALWLATAATARAGRFTCPPDAQRVGPTCVDRYEESVWRVPAGSEKLVKRIQSGKVSLEDLRAAGAEQVSPMQTGNFTCDFVTYGPKFPSNGNWTEPLYAVSVPGVLPSTCITWFQAEQACRLSGKRLITNAEWQAAAQGTPDPGDADDQSSTCATLTEAGALAGARAKCVSTWGVRDMVGNAWEWTADWMPMPAMCGQWPDGVSGDGQDFTCIGFDPAILTGPTPAAFLRAPAREQDARRMFRRVEETSVLPGVPSGVIRGGNFGIGTRAGVFAIYAGIPVYTRSRSTGFRCAR